MMFTVIIPTYNRANFIEKTIGSVLSQEHKDWELIIVDDGSTDNTEEVVRPFLSEKVSYYKVKNSERGAARNFGAKCAKGRFLNFVDSDDLLLSNHLSAASAFINGNKDARIFHQGYNIISPEGRVIKEVRFLENINQSLILEGNVMSCNGVFVEQDFFSKNLFVEDRTLSGSEDYELWFRIGLQEKIFHNPVISSTIINHEDRSVLRIDVGRLEKRILLLINLMSSNLMRSGIHGQERILKLITSHGYSYMALHLALVRNYKRESLKYIRKAIACDPGILFKRRTLATFKWLLMKW